MVIGIHATIAIGPKIKNKTNDTNNYNNIIFKTIVNITTNNNNTGNIVLFFSLDVIFLSELRFGF